MTAQSRFPLLAAGLFGATGVALGALGAHALEAFLTERGMTHAWDSAARYQLFHAVALLGGAGWLRVASGPMARKLIWASRCWSTGIVLFSGSLYVMAIGGPRWLGPITPLGGVALMTGWLFVLTAAFAKEE